MAKLTLGDRCSIVDNPTLAGTSRRRFRDLQRPFDRLPLAMYP
jgi:hypothetical protein